jgi:2-C-methyl-D-erythritol 4-phosphate cytidylyltransferase
MIPPRHRFVASFIFNLQFAIYNIFMTTAIIAAGGRGKRFQSAVPKQLLLLKARPVLAWTLRTFQHEPRIDRILLTHPDDPETIRRYGEIVEQEKITKVVLVPGGEERFHSVRNAFDALQSPVPDDLVLIHDAARPLLSASLLRRLLDAAMELGAVIPVLPVHETLKEVEEDAIVATWPRRRMFLAQTPQVFRHRILEAAYRAAGASHEFTDEAMLVEKSGARVHVIPGERRNIKITEPADLDLAEHYVNQGCE